MGRISLFWEEVDRLTEAERDAIGGLFLHMALRRKIKQREFGAVHQLLTIGYDLGLANTPAASQAAELLARLATFAKDKGSQI